MAFDISITIVASKEWSTLHVHVPNSDYSEMVTRYLILIHTRFNFREHIEDYKVE